jgi:hypothetical protein
MTNNPFHEHEAIFHQNYPGAELLRQFALHLYHSKYPVSMPDICAHLDYRHFRIAVDMLIYYRDHRENCDEFMRVCKQLESKFFDLKTEVSRWQQ